MLQAEANSIQDSAPAIQGLGLISAVNTQEDMSEQDAVLAGALASGSLTGPTTGWPSARPRDGSRTTRCCTSSCSPRPSSSPTTPRMNTLAPTAMQNDLTSVQQAVQAGVPLRDAGAAGPDRPRPGSC